MGRIPFESDTLKELNGKLFAMLIGFSIGFLALTGIGLFSASERLPPYSSCAQIYGNYNGCIRQEDAFLIILSSGKKYEIPSILCEDETPKFNIADFTQRVRRGDPLQLRITQEKENVPYICELKSNGITYLSYSDTKEAFDAYHSEIMTALCIAATLWSGLLIERLCKYFKLKRRLLEKQFLPLENITSSFSVRTPVSGIVKEICAHPGQRVKKGEPVIVVNALKMEILCPAPQDGTIKHIYVRIHNGVQENMVVAILEKL